jgi:hypothetical protein
MNLDFNELENKINEVEVIDFSKIENDCFVDLSLEDATPRSITFNRATRI